MLNFLKRKKKKSIMPWEYELLVAISEKIPSKYSFLKMQANEKFILDSLPNELLKNGWKRIVCDQSLYHSFRNNSMNYKLSGILVYDKKTSDYINIDLDFYEGIIIGYNFGENDKEFDFSQIDVTAIKEVNYENTDIKELEQIMAELSKDIKLKLDLDNTIKIDIPEGEFYTIKDYEDGNYLAINKQGLIFGLFHDPYKIEKIFDNSTDFINALHNNDFNINEYYENKMS